MATTVTIKGVDAETWKLFKIDSVRQGQTIAQHFTQIVKQHCNTLQLEESLKIMNRLRQKAGTWSGTKEITKWRKKRVF
ncbi:hypothetical protein HY485_01740 [Candidatus Woesearchaeota archaeon]|nr:hypothetical protein [Candidatus Woesearchaeota archaeon]